MKVTRFDRVSAGMIAAVLGLLFAVGWLCALWVINRPNASASAAPMEFVELAGGIEDGAIDETLLIESSADPTSDPSLAEVADDVTEFAETLDNVIDQADASTQAARQFETGAVNAGRPGSADGSGRAALGMGPGDSGIPREQRWYIRFDSGASINEYAKQLDFFGIEIGSILPNKTIVYLSNLSAAQPTKRVARSGKDDQRLYMIWQGGQLRRSDIELLGRAGIDAGQAIILHLYPAKVEAELAKLEYEFRERKADTIRRTYFVVKPKGEGYTFVVTRQSYFE